mmetsp:Transcript_24121/g.52493  ORF Transcript_24121/g.52493 Transcript_24121/m.52493 type:complete len:239 (+) Transcript_24121:420-1136(+)
MASSKSAAPDRSRCFARSAGAEATSARGHEGERRASCNFSGNKSTLLRTLARSSAAKAEERPLTNRWFAMTSNKSLARTMPAATASSADVNHFARCSGSRAVAVWMLTTTSSGADCRRITSCGNAASRSVRAFFREAGNSGPFVPARLLDSRQAASAALSSSPLGPTEDRRGRLTPWPWELIFGRIQESRRIGGRMQNVERILCMYTVVTQWDLLRNNWKGMIGEERSGKTIKGENNN